VVVEILRYKFPNFWWVLTWDTRWGRPLDGGIRYNYIIIIINITNQLIIATAVRDFFLFIKFRMLIIELIEQPQALKVTLRVISIVFPTSGSSVARRPTVHELVKAL
jgi:hypothetical protein